MADMAPRREDKAPGGLSNTRLFRAPHSLLPPLPHSLAYLLQHFDKGKVLDIMNRSDKTFEQKIDSLREEISAFERAREDEDEYEYEYEDEDEDEDEDADADEVEDEADEKMFVDENKADIMKRPLPFGEELEYKKPKTADGSRCQGEEPEAEGMKNSSWV